MAKTEPVSEEQAEAALQQVLNLDEGSELTQTEPAPEPTIEEPVEVSPPAEPAVEPTGDPAVEVDDVTLLKQRNEELEAQSKEIEERYNSRLRAIQERSSATDKIRQDRYLRKSTAADNARRILVQSRSEAGAAEADVERVIQELDGTMHPSSASHAVEPESEMAPREDQEIVLNRFLDEKLMTLEDQEEFGNWLRSDATTQMTESEQGVARDSLDGFLRLAHPRWEGSREAAKKAKTDDAVQAAKSVQRTQKAAIRAAGTSPKAPRKTPTSTKTEIDTSKFTNEDVSDLLRQSVEQYR